MKKRLVVGGLLICSLFLVSCSPKKAETNKIKKESRIATKEDLKMEEDLAYYHIKDKNTGELEKLSSEDKDIKEIIEFADSYLETTVNVNEENIKNTYSLDKDYLSKYLSKDLVEDIIKEDKELSKEDKLLVEKEKKEELESFKNNRVSINLVNIEDIKDILLSPSKKYAAVFVNYHYTVKRLKPSDKEVTDLIYIEEPFSQSVVLNLIKEEDKWKLQDKLDLNNTDQKEVLKEDFLNKNKLED